VEDGGRRERLERVFELSYFSRGPREVSDAVHHQESRKEDNTPTSHSVLFFCSGSARSTHAYAFKGFRHMHFFSNHLLVRLSSPGSEEGRTEEEGGVYIPSIIRPHTYASYSMYPIASKVLSTFFQH
jgi:hypothetical protein